MSILNNIVHVSINRSFNNKTEYGDKRVFVQGFLDSDIPISDFCDAINQGFAFSYQYKNKPRNTKNFYRSNIAIVSIDEGISLEDFQALDFVKKYCTFIHTTYTHTDLENKFRAYFLLDSPLTISQDLKALSRALAKLLGGDLSATDAAHMFYGNDRATFINLNNTLPDDVVADLIEKGSTDSISDSAARNGNPSATRIKIRLKQDAVVKNASGKDVIVGDIKSNMSIYCPYHLSKKPNAYIGFNSTGNKFLYCPICQITQWVDQIVDTTLSTDKFEEELIKFKEIHSIKRQKPAEASLNVLFDDYQSYIESIDVQEERYLKLEQLLNGINFIKSGKGSGKTTVVADLVKKEVRNNKNLKVLLIGHRRALISHLCERFQLTNYLSEPNQKHWNRVGICLDSLIKLPHYKYDIVIIDEVEQVLNHFMSDTLYEESVSIFKALEEVLQNAKKTICMDADLTWSSALSVTKLSNINGTNRKDVNFTINKWRPKGSEVFLYKYAEQLIGNLQEKLKEGKRVFFTSNSRAMVNNLFNVLESTLVHGREIKLIKITSENSVKQETQEFVTDIANKILEYDIVLTSPSMSTGVDITFPNQKQEIDCVFGYFENRINTHPEIDQQISRVRHPKEVHIFISPQRYNFETDFAIVNQEYLKTRLEKVLIPTEDLLLNMDYTKVISDYLYMCTWLTILRRHSLNNLKENYIAYKSKQGTEIIEVGEDALKPLGNNLMVQGKLISKEKYIQALMSAKKILFNQYIYLKDFEVITTEEHMMLRKFELDRFYRTDDATREQIIADDNGMQRRKIRFFEQLTNPSVEEKMKGVQSKLKHFKMDNKLHLSILKEKDVDLCLLYALLSTTKIYINYAFNSKTAITNQDLDDFRKAVESFKPFLAAQFELVPRKDLRTKPIAQLNVFLNLIGLQIKCVKKKVVNKKKIYFYKLDKDSLNLMKAFKSIREADITNDRFIYYDGTNILFTDEVSSKYGVETVCAGSESFSATVSTGNNVSLKTFIYRKIISSEIVSHVLHVGSMDENTEEVTTENREIDQIPIGDQSTFEEYIRESVEKMKG